ncbi:MAG: phosphodiesterase [Rhodobacterales bacterium]|nr:MAG: phosphodiesterase [Rhodobacterales bacterium]
MPDLDPAFLTQPLAHRALHDISQGRPENSRAAIRAAVAAGYGIEIDLQLSMDGQAMVFHDYDLARLTGTPGPIRQKTADALANIPLLHGDGEGVPTLTDILDLVAGHAPLLFEIKDQDGAMGPDVGPLEHATAQALKDYRGPVALMSFNPHAVAALARMAPQIPRGLTTCAYDPQNWPLLPPATCDRLARIPDYARVGAGFVSHNVHDLHNPRLGELKAGGAHILCWTVTSARQETEARNIAENITFEGYMAARPS